MEEDEPKTMDIILRILYFHPSSDALLNLSSFRFASIAVHSDKYDCRRALTGWIQGWLRTNDFGTFSKQPRSQAAIGYNLLSVYMFRLDSLSKLATDAARYLKLDFRDHWEKQKLLSLIPDTLTGMFSYTNYRY